MTANFEIVQLSGATDKAEFISKFSKFSSDVNGKNTNLSKEHYLQALLEYGQIRNADFWLAIDTSNQTILARLGADIPANRPLEGSIGFFDCSPTANGKSAALALMKEALQWLSARKAQHIFAPMDFNSWFQYRFKLKDHNNPSVIDHPWEPTVPDMHVEIFSEAGFREALRFASFNFEVADEGIWDAYISRLESDHQRALESGFEIRGLNWDARLAEDLKHIFEISCIAFAENPMFEKIPFEIFAKTIGATANASNTMGSRICFSKEGQPVAFEFSFITNKTVIYKTVAVLPQFQEMGIANAMTYELCQVCKIHQVKKSIGALIRKGNASENIGRGFAKFALSSGQDEYILMHWKGGT